MAAKTIVPVSVWFHILAHQLLSREWKKERKQWQCFRKCWKTKPERMCERGWEVRGRRAGGPVPDGTETNHRSVQEGIVQVLPSTFSSFVGPGAFSCRSPWMRRPVLGCLSRVRGGSYLPQTLPTETCCPPSFAAWNPLLSTQSLTRWRKPCVRGLRNRAIMNAFLYTCILNPSKE